MDVFFQSHPDVILATNTFRNVPTIIQYEDTPLLEVGKYEPAGYSAKFSIYHSDGTKIGVVKGSQLYPTEAGKKAKVTPRYEPNLTVWELEGKPILELRREGAAALRGWAELYAPEGVLIKAIDSGISGLLRGGNALQVGGVTMSGAVFDGCKIGIHVRRNGIGLGAGGGTIFTGYMSICGGQAPPANPPSN
jgi:hypothetical protein